MIYDFYPAGNHFLIGVAPDKKRYMFGLAALLFIRGWVGG